MNICIEIPTWLGDAVMTTPAIENILQKYPDAKLTLFGSFVSIHALKEHPNVIHTAIDTSKKERFRYLALYRQARALGEFDLAFSFRRTLSAKLFLRFIKSKQSWGYRRFSKKERHQVLRYNDFINHTLKSDNEADVLRLYHDSKKKERPTLGINPGATYGSAKRWYPEKFAKVAIALSNKYDILIFGGPGEVDIANDIEKDLKDAGIQNYQNIAGKTSVKELIEQIASVQLFITADSGPMHVAAAYKIPTVALFGPTKHTETSPWKNPHSHLIYHDMACAPCMKRSCPLKENIHACMKEITPQEVIEVAKSLS